MIVPRPEKVCFIAELLLESWENLLRDAGNPLGEVRPRGADKGCQMAIISTGRDERPTAGLTTLRRAFQRGSSFVASLQKLIRCRSEENGFNFSSEKTD